MCSDHRHDAVFVYKGHGALGNDSELRIAVAALRRFCSSWLRHIIVVGDKPDINGIIHIPASDPYKHDKDANIIYKLLIASRTDFISEDFLFCSDDQLVTCESQWSDFIPRHVAVYGNPDSAYWTSKRERGTLWQRRMVATLDRFGIGAKYFEPHIWCPVNKAAFIRMCESFPWQSENGIVVMSLYNNFAQVSAQPVFDHVSLREPPFNIPKGVRHIGYFNAAFLDPAFRKGLEDIVKKNIPTSCGSRQCESASRSPKVSLIIPSWNTQESVFIQCLDSVIAQPNNGEMEVIVIDDGATDITPRILDERCAGLPYWRVVHTDNHGNGPARNLGIDMARGEWIAFLDCDDTLAPDWLVNALDTIDKATPAMNIFQYNIDFVRNGIRSPHNYCYRQMSWLFPNQPLNFVFVWAKLYRRSLLVDNNIRFPSVDDLTDLLGCDVPTFQGEIKRYVRGEYNFFTAVAHAIAGRIHIRTWVGTVHYIRKESLGHRAVAGTNLAHPSLCLTFAALAVEARRRNLDTLADYADKQASDLWAKTDKDALPRWWQWQYDNTLK